MSELRVPFLIPLLALVALSMLALLGCSSDREEPSGPGDAPAGAAPPDDSAPPADRSEPAGTPHATKVAALGDTVTAIAAVPDGSALLVGTRSGLVHRLALGETDAWTSLTLDHEPVLDLSAETTTEGERGLLDLAFSPDGSSLYASFTAADDGAVTLRAYAHSADADQTLQAPRTIVSVPHPFSGHNGGGLAVAEEGDLYWSLGDMATSRPPLAQLDHSLLGKVVRIAADDLAQDAASDPPVDVVALGLRNPWRISIDETGSLWIADVGETRVEEINRVTAEQLTGEPPNFGWPYFEGTEPFVPDPPGDLSLVDPLLAREHGPSVCAVTGGHVYRGTQLEDLAGRYVFGDSCGGEILALDERGNATGEDGNDVTTIAQVPESVTTFGESHGGELYIGGIQGGLYRLDPPRWEVEPNEQSPDVTVPSTTSTTILPVELCEIPRVFEDLGRVVAADPRAAEKAVQQAIDRLASVPRLVPEDLEGDVETLTATLRAIQDMGRRLDWDTDAPEFTRFIEDLATGTGAVPEFAGALQRVSTRLGPSCPTDQPTG